MNTLQRVRANLQLIASAREAAKAGKSLDDWQAEALEAVPTGVDFLEWVEIILTLLALLQVLFKK